MQFITGRTGRVALVGVVSISLLAVALGTYLPVAFASSQGETREFIVDARRFAYSPNRLTVNIGDTVILRLRPQDVSHGLYLDGYGLKTDASPAVPGVPGGEGVLEFVADRPGKFRYRCSVTCGPLHPFMIGELNVESGTPYTNAPFLGAVAATILVSGATLVYVWGRKETDGGIAN